MQITRREFVVIAGSAMLGTVPASRASSNGPINMADKEMTTMYGLIGQIKTVPGQRDALISILISGGSGMPGCLSYIVAQDPLDLDSI